MVSSCLVPGPRLIEGKENMGLVCENLIKEKIGRVNSELVGLYVKNILPGKLFGSQLVN